MRATFEARTAGLEGRLLRLGQLVQTQLSQALEAVATGDAALAQAVIAGDAAVNRAHAEIEQELLAAMPQLPGSPHPDEVRLLAALLHVNAHLEHMGDLCASIARLAHATAGQPPVPAIQATLAEMGEHARRLIAAALAGFARRDLDLAGALPHLDDPLDRLNKQVLGQVEQAAGAAPRSRGWATRMLLVARHLERLGDHAVDLGEQAGFVVTGGAPPRSRPRQASA